MHSRTAAAAALALAALAPPSAVAEPVLGLWRTEPDGKGQTGHVRFRACGSAYCGTIVAAHDSSGQQITTENVGRQVVSGLSPQGAGTYEGRVFVPIMGQDFPATIEVAGETMELQACNAIGICRSRTWRRVE
jgi:uncharacterized protein (DUF2147 family)